MQPWIETELASADLGDRRLDRRLKTLLDEVSAHPGASIPVACGSRADYEAAYRLFDNEKVDAAQILAPHALATRERARCFERVLLIQDTTEIDLTRPSERVGGRLAADGHAGLLAHVHMVATPGGLPLGVASARLWARPPAVEAPRQRKHRRPQERESYRWLEGYKAASALARDLEGASEVVAVSDSEGDIFACLEEADAGEHDPQSARYVIRACHDRRLVGTQKRLFATVAASEVLFTAALDVRPREALSFDERRRKAARTSRRAVVSVKGRSVEIRRPPDSHGDEADPVDGIRVNCVLVSEQHPPEGQPGIEWLLVTDLPIDDGDDVLAVIEAYKARWTIEDYFKVLKSGCRVEQLQLETQARLEAALALYMIVAWRVLYVTRLGRAYPEVSCEAIFEPDEWRSVYVIVRRQSPPAKPPTLRDMVRMIGRLGGWADRRRDSEPGSKALWIGIGRMRDFAAAWLAFGPEARPCH